MPMMMRLERIGSKGQASTISDKSASGALGGALLVQVAVFPAILREFRVQCRPLVADLAEIEILLDQRAFGRAMLNSRQRLSAGWQVSILYMGSTK